MEQIVNSFLKQQGIEYIGSFDKEKNVWIYIKDGEVHFCKSDLTPINKDAIGLGNDLLILAETDGCIHKINDNESFSNFIVIDGSNKILVRVDFGECDSSSKREKNLYVLKRVNQETFFMVSESYLDSCGFDDKNKPAMNSLFSWDTGDKKYSYLFKENKYMENHHLGSYYQDFYFFKNVVDHTLTLINCENGRMLDEVEYGGWLPCLWIHADTKAQIVIVKNDSDHVNNDMEPKGNTTADNIILSGAVTIIELEHWFYTYNYIVSDYMLPSDINYDNTELDYNYFEKPYKFLYTDDYIVLPFSKKYGAFVVDYLGDRFAAHSIIFDDYYEYYRVELHGQLIHLDKSQTYYDIYGNKIGSYDKHDYYMVYSDEKSLLATSRNDEVKGVIGIWSNRIVVPPIFKEIEIIDDENGLFEVTYRINAKNMQKETKGLYSADEGFLIPFGSEYEFPEYYNNVLDKRTFYTETINKFLIFKIGEKYGLIYKGRIVLEANYDWITGFSFWDDFKEEPDTSFYLWDEASDIEQKTRDYSPLCVILRKHSKFGLFCEKENGGNKKYEVIDPDYDAIKFIKIFDKHTYFKVERNGKAGIISDNLSFNKQGELIYDEVTFKTIIGDKCFFTISKDGKEGAVCTNERYNIPNIFDKIDNIVRSGVICNNILYNRNGEQVFSLDEYYYIKTRYYDVFKSTESEDFVFIDSIGNTVSYEKDEDDENILHVSGIKESFDIEEEDFVEEEEDYNYDYDDGYTQEELDDMYRAAFEGDPDAQWNID